MVLEKLEFHTLLVEDEFGTLTCVQAIDAAGNFFGASQADSVLEANLSTEVLTQNATEIKELAENLRNYAVEVYRDIHKADESVLTDFVKNHTLMVQLKVLKILYRKNLLSHSPYAS